MECEPGQHTFEKFDSASIFCPKCGACREVRPSFAPHEHTAGCWHPTWVYNPPVWVQPIPFYPPTSPTWTVWSDGNSRTVTTNGTFDAGSTAAWPGDDAVTYTVIPARA